MMSAYRHLGVSKRWLSKFRDRPLRCCDVRRSSSTLSAAETATATRASTQGSDADLFHFLTPPAPTLPAIPEAKSDSSLSSARFSQLHRVFETVQTGEMEGQSWFDSPAIFSAPSKSPLSARSPSVSSDPSCSKVMHQRQLDLEAKTMADAAAEYRVGVSVCVRRGPAIHGWRRGRRDSWSWCGSAERPG
jgi:hypothetical protein